MLQWPAASGNAIRHQGTAIGRPFVMLHSCHHHCSARDCVRTIDGTVLPMAAYPGRIWQLHPGVQLWGCHLCPDMGPSNWSQGPCLLWHGLCSQSHDDISVWSQALSHSRCVVIGCVCILSGALVFQHQDIQAFQGITLPGSFTNKPDIVRHTSDGCTCLAEGSVPAAALMSAHLGAHILHLLSWSRQQGSHLLLAHS